MCSGFYVDRWTLDETGVKLLALIIMKPNLKEQTNTLLSTVSFLYWIRNQNPRSRLAWNQNLVKTQNSDYFYEKD